MCPNSHSIYLQRLHTTYIQMRLPKTLEQEENVTEDKKRRKNSATETSKGKKKIFARFLTFAFY